jgi:hypothetical protein
MRWPTTRTRCTTRSGSRPDLGRAALGVEAPLCVRGAHRATSRLTVGPTPGALLHRMKHCRRPHRRHSGSLRTLGEERKAKTPPRTFKLTQRNSGLDSAKGRRVAEHAATNSLMKRRPTCPQMRQIPQIQPPEPVSRRDAEKQAAMWIRSGRLRWTPHAWEARQDLTGFPGIDIGVSTYSEWPRSRTALGVAFRHFAATQRHVDLPAGSGKGRLWPLRLSSGTRR